MIKIIATHKSIIISAAAAAASAVPGLNSTKPFFSLFYIENNMNSRIIEIYFFGIDEGR